jgi:hypothetical protein
MHLAKLDGVPFTELPPAKDLGERVERAKKGILGFVSKQGGNVVDAVEKIDKKVDEKIGWKDKIGGLLRRKSK